MSEQENVLENHVVAEDVAVEVDRTEEVQEDTTAEVVSDEVASNEPGLPAFRAGDTLRLGVRITEGEKVRTQYFEGIVLGVKGAGVSKTFTIRKIAAGGIAVERIFPLNSPSLVSIEVRRRGITRRAKVYFLRDIVGSTANVIKEKKIVRERVAKAPKAEKQPKVKVEKTNGSSRSARRAAAKTV